MAHEKIFLDFLILYQTDKGSSQCSTGIGKTAPQAPRFPKPVVCLVVFKTYIKKATAVPMVAMGIKGMAMNLRSKKWYETTTIELNIAVCTMFLFPKNQMYSKGIFLPINIMLKVFKERYWHKGIDSGFRFWPYTDNKLVAVGDKATSLLKIFCFLARTARLFKAKNSAYKIKRCASICTFIPTPFLRHEGSLFP